MKVMLMLGLLLLSVRAYIDFHLQINTAGSDIALVFPLTINKTEYRMGVSLQNEPEFIVSSGNGKPKGKSHKLSSSPQASLKVSSLQGYTFQGWRRYFMQVLLSIEQQEYHEFTINLAGVKQRDKFNSLSDGVMALGPRMADNHIYGLIKKQMGQFVHEDVVGFYSAPGGKEVHMQLGGYEQTHARGHSNGILFYEKPLEVSADEKHWSVSVQKVLISRESSNRWETFTLPSSKISARLSLESQFIVLPQHMRDDIETSLFSQHVECSMKSQLQCYNISSIDQALTFISFMLDEQIYLNLSLYELRDTYNNKDKITTFFVKLGADNELQIGAPILRNYYVVINMSRPSLLFSPLNRFKPEVTTVAILRFLIIFMLFMLLACIAVIFWQQFNDPQAKRRSPLRSGKDGVRLVAYQRASEFDDEEDD